MKIWFVKKEDLNEYAKRFALYQYDESFVQHSNYIDIKTIIKEKHLQWLDEIHKSYRILAERSLRLTRWWLLTEVSRIDGRAWAQEYFFKPLFFARALIQWLEKNPDVHEILLIGCDPLVANYLKEMRNDYVIKGAFRIPFLLQLVLNALKGFLKEFWKIIKQAPIIFFYSVLKQNNFIRSKNLILYEYVVGCADHTYYYGSLFDVCDKENQICYSCISPINRKRMKNFYSQHNTKTFYLLDNLRLIDLILSIFINSSVIFLIIFIAFFRIPCTIENKHVNYFWSLYIIKELVRSPFMINNICVYKCLKRILKKGEYKQVIYPYEEKGIERAILFACEEERIKTIGYAPHPQHRLDIGLRDIEGITIPRPTGYAVCGLLYIDYLKSWGRKSDTPIALWGSGKDFQKIKSTYTSFSNPIKILLLLSHPHELMVFSTWLMAEPRLSKNVIYYLRFYRSIKGRHFIDELEFLNNNFNCIKESKGTLIQDLLECDFAIFCATSAGVVAIKHGFLSIHVCLDDFFEMNPCFDIMDSVLSCESASQFADRIDMLRSINQKGIAQLCKKQQDFADKIFSRKQTDIIKGDILC